jgi:hypothetical protein
MTLVRWGEAKWGAPFFSASITVLLGQVALMALHGSARDLPNIICHFFHALAAGCPWDTDFAAILALSTGFFSTNRVTSATVDGKFVMPKPRLKLRASWRKNHPSWERNLKAQPAFGAKFAWWMVQA